VTESNPPFHTQERESRLKVVVVPEGSPEIRGLETEYVEGGDMKVDCLTPPAFPKPSVAWYINNLKVNAGNQLVCDFVKLTELWNCTSSFSSLAPVPSSIPPLPSPPSPYSPSSPPPLSAAVSARSGTAAPVPCCSLEVRCSMHMFEGTFTSSSTPSLSFEAVSGSRLVRRSQPILGEPLTSSSPSLCSYLFYLAYLFCYLSYYPLAIRL